MGLARMLLMFQKQLDRTTASLPGLTGGTSPINMQIWRMAKIDCLMLQALLPQAQWAESQARHGLTDAVDDSGRIQYGGFAGCFDASHRGRAGEALNLNAPVGLRDRNWPRARRRASLNLIADKSAALPVFDREDSNRAQGPVPLPRHRCWRSRIMRRLDDEVQTSPQVNTQGW